MNYSERQAFATVDSTENSHLPLCIRCHSTCKVHKILALPLQNLFQSESAQVRNRPTCIRKSVICILLQMERNRQAFAIRKIEKQSIKCTQNIRPAVRTYSHCKKMTSKKVWVMSGTARLTRRCSTAVRTAVKPHSSGHVYRTAVAAMIAANGGYNFRRSITGLSAAPAVHMVTAVRFNRHLHRRTAL